MLCLFHFRALSYINDITALESLHKHTLQNRITFKSCEQETHHRILKIRHFKIMGNHRYKELYQVSFMSFLFHFLVERISRFCVAAIHE